MTSLSLFFPCYNDAGTIGSLIAAADTVAREFTNDYEIIVVDDGSTDASRDLLQALSRAYPSLKPVFHERNRGYGGALRTGFATCSKDLIFYTDGDGQYDVFELCNLLPVLQDGVDVVNGYKIERHDPVSRIILGQLYLMFMRLAFQFEVRDVDCDFRLLRSSCVRSISLTHDSGVICLELVKKLEMAGYRFAEFPVHHYQRICGRSQFFNVRRLVATGVNILRLWTQLFILRRTPSNIAHSSEAELQRRRTNGSLASRAPLSPSA